MTADKRAADLARTFMEGFAENFRCPDVSPLEYRGVMEYRIAEAIREAVQSERKACIAVCEAVFAECPEECALGVSEVMTRIAARK